MVRTDTGTTPARGKGGLHSTLQLGLVPFGEGELKPKHPGPNGRFPVRCHLFGGGSEEAYATLADGSLKLPFHEQTGSGKLIEWIEIDLGPGENL